MKALFLCVFVSAALIGCSSNDSIDRLVADLTHHRPELDRHPFPNGFWNNVALPATASPAQLLAKLPSSGSLSLNTTNFTILKTRHVHIAYYEEYADKIDPNYTAILVRTGSGQKIVLAQFHGNSTNDMWETRIYDIK
jgi:hypothetical protein